MPEGHSIHRLAAAITELFSGSAVRASSPQGRFSAGAALVDGHVPLPAQAWGKHLFIPFVSAEQATDAEADLGGIGELGSDIPTWIQIHLGLYGSWTFSGDSIFAGSSSIGAPRRKIGEGDDTVSEADDAVWEAPTPRETVRLRLETPHGVGDLTGPNQCRILNGGEVREILSRLGPDPLRNDDGDRTEFIRRARKRRSPIGGLVMDQSVIAGPGNIYRAECLFRVGIHPYRQGAKVSAQRLGLLWDDLVDTMNDGVRTGKIWTVPDELAPVEPIDGDDEASRFAVYHRTGRPCLRCGSKINEALMQGRRLFWCPGCQR